MRKVRTQGLFRITLWYWAQATESVWCWYWISYKSPAHGTNVRDKNYAVSLLEKLTNLRSILKKTLVEMGVQNYWLLKGLAAIQGIAPLDKRGSNRDSLPELMSSIRPDNVHLTLKAYQNIAHTVGKIFVGLRDGKLGKNSVASLVSGPEGSNRSYPRLGAPVSTSCRQKSPDHATPIRGESKKNTKAMKKEK
jgi:hypothetical protein